MAKKTKVTGAAKSNTPDGISNDSNLNSQQLNSGLINSEDNMVFVEGGEFIMGSDSVKANQNNAAHKVVLDSFWIGKYAVTSREWREIMEPGSKKPLQNKEPYVGDQITVMSADYFLMGKQAKPEYPVVTNSWFDAIVFCNKKSKQEGLTPVYITPKGANPEILAAGKKRAPGFRTLTGKNCTDENGRYATVLMNPKANGYRLPTEAEWEYAARGGVKSQGFIYSGSNDLDEVAWYQKYSGSDPESVQPVGSKKPNELGIYDMSGNVWEWCWDWWEGNYSKSPVKNPEGPKFGDGDSKCVRGGTFYELEDTCRVYFRIMYGIFANMGVGFRIVRSAK